MSTFLNASPVFGPVHSRRLGISLGVNLMPASGKICSFDCIYCENGYNCERRTPEGHRSAADVARELGVTLRSMAERGDAPDVITFAGNGEPTAAPEFAQAIDAAIALRDELAPAARIAVLSNGTFADRPEVREALLRVDDNILKLDSVDPDFIRLVDRPVGPYDVESRIRAFAAFEGRCMVQTIFLRGTFDGRVVDDTDEPHVAPWLNALGRIAPSAATIYTIARETPAPDLEKCPADVLDSIAGRVRARGIACSVSY